MKPIAIWQRVSRLNSGIWGNRIQRPEQARAIDLGLLNGASVREYPS
jgi:hypothetical protein